MNSMAVHWLSMKVCYVLKNAFSILFCKKKMKSLFVLTPID